MQWFSLFSDHDDHKMDNKNSCESAESGKEVTNCKLDAAEFLVDLCFSLSTSNVEKLISTICPEGFDLKMLQESVLTLRIAIN